MTSIYEKKISAEVRLIHAEQMSSYFKCLYDFIILRKKTMNTDETTQARHFNQYESISFPKL